jgi:hypothetical protein
MIEADTIPGRRYQRCFIMTRLVSWCNLKVFCIHSFVEQFQGWVYVTLISRYRSQATHYDMGSVRAIRVLKNECVLWIAI